ncbi:MAG: class I SAM-dependent methyltransferase [Calditrichaeota bacterium]|nr:class I SAM-dependent methyltransferase [Calditrichota bacterium]
MTKLPHEVPDNWFKDWFDDFYLKVYQHRDKSEAERFVAKWQIWDNINKGGYCLDLGCGSGRYATEIAQHGFKVIALDLSIPLLKTAVTENNLREQILYVRGDMRAIPARSGFSLIVSLFTSFGYFNDSQHLQLLRDVRKLLEPGGVFVLDVPNPQAVRLNVSNSWISVRIENDMHIREERFISDDNTKVVKFIKIDYQGESKEYFESVRLYEFEELSDMLESCGFKKRYPVQGDYDGCLFTTESPRMVFFMGVK